jgi:hypothetical protein
VEIGSNLNFLFADIHVSHLSNRGVGVSSRKARFSSSDRISVALGDGVNGKEKTHCGFDALKSEALEKALAPFVPRIP